MCEFISWIEVEKEGVKNILHLDDKELFSERSSEILKKCKDNDFIGHHAIRDVFGAESTDGVQREVRNFWETNRLPKEIQAKLHDFASFEKNFGRMISEYAQKDDLEYIVEAAPSDQKWKGLKKFCKDILADFFRRKVKTGTLEVNVRHDLSVDELVSANKFGWKHECVTSENYPARKKPVKKEELVLVSMGADASTKDVLKAMKALKLRPAKPVALLSLGLEHPDRQKENPIVALGQTWRDSGGGRRVPYLAFDGGRGLDLGWCGRGWGAGCRFLAVRNS